MFCSSYEKELYAIGLCLYSVACTYYNLCNGFFNEVKVACILRASKIYLSFQRVTELEVPASYTFPPISTFILIAIIMDFLCWQVVFRGGEGALQVLPPLVDVIPEARLNLVIYYLRQGKKNLS